MKVLVTGSEGYIGTVLVPIFRAAGHSVTRLDSLLFRKCAFTEVEAIHEGCPAGHSQRHSGQRCWPRRHHSSGRIVERSFG